MTELIEKLREKLGGGAFEKALGEVSALLDEAGMRAYLEVVDLFTSFDSSVARRLLLYGVPILAPLGDERSRRQVLELIRAMGRPKWSVARAAIDKLPSMSAMEPHFINLWLSIGHAIADIDQDAAVNYFEASPEVVASVGTEGFKTWASLGVEIVKMSWKAAKEYLRSSPQVLKKIDPSDLEKWARLGFLLIEKSPEIKANYDAHSLLAAGAAAGKSRKLDLAVQYFKSAPQILSRLSIEDLRQWVMKGLETADSHTDKGTAFFSLQTGGSRKAVDGLVRGLELKDVHAVLRSYAEALIGKPVLLRSSSLFYKNLPGLSRSFSVTDGKRVFLPSNISLFADRDLNFKAYKLALVHNLAHMEFGTFELRPEELKDISALGDPVAALRVFEFIEDERVDYLMGKAYPGIEKDREKLMEDYSRPVSEEGSAPESPGPGPEAGGNGSTPGEGSLAGLLKKAVDGARRPTCTVRDALALASSVVGGLAGAGVSLEGLRSAERLFYRGVLDFDLVERARKGFANLVLEMLDRVSERKMEVERGRVEEALQRIEESEGLESEFLLWQLDDREKLDELFDQLVQVLAEMEAEKRFRRTVYYDEWDRTLDDYRKEWCRVRELDMPETGSSFYRRTIEEHYGIISVLRRHFGLLRPDRIKRFFREERGDDIDYDALVESVVERHAGVTPSDRVYVRREKNLRDVSVAFLADMSYSTSDLLPSGKRIIDIEREGLIMMAEALESIGDQWAVYGFSTHCRAKVDFFIVRDFAMPFNEDVKMRFENIRPMQQTRLGAVIRHASRLLERQNSRIRILILLSDGRPYDIDYGDADYAVEDTRRALWETRRKGISCFCITVDKKSREYLPYMYGESNYILIDNVDALPVMMPMIYKHLTT